MNLSFFPDPRSPVADYAQEDLPKQQVLDITLSNLALRRSCCASSVDPGSCAAYPVELAKNAPSITPKSSRLL